MDIVSGWVLRGGFPVKLSGFAAAVLLCFARIIVPGGIEAVRLCGCSERSLRRVSVPLDLLGPGGERCRRQ